MNPISINEPARRTLVSETADVVVCGGGPAGIAAAISAARAGARTRLLEGHGALGGIWTTGLLGYVLDADKREGLLPELVERLKARDSHRLRNGANFLFHPEVMKVVLEEMCLEAGVELRFHTHVVAAMVSPQKRLEAVITESKSGREAWMAPVFIDCTGDGDVGALAGCSFSVGREGTGEVQPLSLLAMVSGIDPDELNAFFDERRKGDWAGKHAFLEALREGGHEPSYGYPGLFHVRDQLFIIMANHQYGVPHDDAQAITDATIRARSQVEECMKALRRQGGVWRNLELVATGAQIGVREGRRIHGRETVTVGDLAAGRARENAVCRVTFGIDVHSTNPGRTKGIEAAPVQTRPYDIPYGSLVAADVEGLLMAGRCISGDFLTHSSYRVTGNAVAMGEAAGRAAARCVREGRPPHEIPFP